MQSAGLVWHGWHYRRCVRGRWAGDAVTSRHLGLDLGGTNLKWAVVEQDGPSPRALASGQVPTDVSRGERSVVDQLIEIARGSFRDLGLMQSVGVGVPGLYDPVAGKTRFMPNVPGKWAGVPVAAEVSASVGAPVRLINDARAFTLAEHRLGAGRGAQSMLGITLGTGIGGGLILNGLVYMGHDGTAGEFGHQTILPDGPACNCGSRGCLEALAKADAIVRVCGQPTVTMCVEAARAGDRQAQKGLTEVGQYLGIGVGNVVALLSVDRVVVGGGVAAAGDLLLEPLRAELRRRVFITDLDAITVVGAELGIWAGAIGAALHGAGAELAVR
jgi:glucokinase